MANLIYDYILGSFRLRDGSAVGTVTEDHIFESAAARDAYFNTPDPHLNDLILGTPIVVNIGTAQNPNVRVQVWSAPSRPTTYPNPITTQWADAGSTTLTTVQLTLLAGLAGVSNGSIPVKSGNTYASSAMTESSSEVLSTKNMRAPQFFGGTDFLRFENSAELSSTSQTIEYMDRSRSNRCDAVMAPYTNSGSSRPIHKQKSALMTLVDQTLADANSANFTFEAGLAEIAGRDGLKLISFVVTPHAAGIGTFTIRRDNASGEIITSPYSFTVTVGEVGVDKPVQIGTRIDLNNGEDFFVTYTGPALRGHVFNNDPIYETGFFPRLQIMAQPFLDKNVALEEDVVQSNWNETDTNSNAYITNRPNTFDFKGVFDPNETYYQGQTVRSNYLGRPAIYMAAAALLPSTTLPEARLETGHWFLVTNRVWRGNWVASDYIPGQVVRHSSSTWMAIQLIGVSDTNPPSATNTSWVQIDASGGGGGTVFVPVINYRRQSVTLTFPSSNYSVEVFEDTGTDTQTATFPQATSGNINKRFTIVNNRPDVNARVNLAFNSSDTVVGLFGSLSLNQGESITFIVSNTNQYSIIGESVTPTFPNFSANPENEGNSFMFSVNGDGTTPVNSGQYANAWTRDRNTAINLNSSAGATYELANPGTSGITVNDGDGYIFRNIGTGTWAIYPFASNNTFYVGNTQYTRDSLFNLPANQSLVVVYSTSQSRWNGTLFTRLLPIGASGAVGSSGGGIMSASDSGIFYAQNKDTVSISKGDALFVEGDSNVLGAVKAGLGVVVNAMALEDAATNATFTISRFSEVEIPDVYNGSNRIGEPMSVGTNIYNDPDNKRLDIDHDSNSRQSLGEVIASSWIYPVVQHTSSQVIDTQAEWDNWIFKVQEKNWVTAGSFEIPDLAEGSSEVTAVAGQKFIVSMPQGNGTISIRPRGASEIRNHPTENPGTQTTHTNSNALALTGAVIDEYIIIEVNSSADGYWYYRVNDQGINTRMYFDALTHLQAVTSDSMINFNGRIANNTQAISNLQQHPRTEISTHGSYSINTSVEWHLVSTGANAARNWTFAANQGIGDNRTVIVTVENDSSSYPVNITKSGGNYLGMNTDTIAIAPNEVRRFIVTKDASVTQITPLGPVIYEFTATTADTTGANPSINLTGVPTWLAAIVSKDATNADRLNANVNVAKIECRIEYVSGWGAATGILGAMSSITNRLDYNGSNGSQVVPSRTLQWNAYANIFSHTFSQSTVNSGQYVNPYINITSVSAHDSFQDMQFHFKVILKEY